MSFINRIVLCIVLFTVSVNCQGSGGGGGSGGFAAFSIAIFLLPCYCIWRCCAGKPSQSNAKYVTQSSNNYAEKQTLGYESFQSGQWESQYFQYKIWHGPHYFQLAFYPAQLTVTGSGSDDVGSFSIEGFYSIETRRIALTKTYQLGTGNPLQNLGHQVLIQVEWNELSRAFEGKWYVRTSKFRGSDKFTLKFSNQQQQQYETLPPPYEKV